MAAVVLGSGIVFLDSTVINVALPVIGRELPSRLFGVLEAQSYVWNGYLLTLSALLILAGALSDFHGRRKMFSLGLVGFGVTSLMCGLAPNMELLVTFRVLQGATGALLVPGSLSIITSSFSGEEQGRAFGIWAGASGATTIAGPLIGGLLVESISWRAAFLMNVPLVIFAYYATAAHVAESKDENATGRFDWLGAVVVALAVGGLAFGAIRGQEHMWQDPAAFVALGIGAVATVSFPLLMARSPHPLVPLHLFRSRNFSVTNLSTLIIYGALYVSTYLVAIFTIGTLGYNPPAAGVAFVPATIFLVLFSSYFGKLAARYGPRLFMAAGPALMMLGILWFARIPADSDAWTLRGSDPSTFLPPLDYLMDFFPGWIVFGLGLMMMVAPLTTALMTSVPSHNAGVASAINNAISRVGPQLTLAVVFIAVTATFQSTMSELAPGIDSASPEIRENVSPLNRPSDDVPPAIVSAAKAASTDAFHLAMLISAGLLAAGAFVNAAGIRRVSLPSGQGEVPREAATPPLPCPPVPVEGD